MVDERLSLNLTEDEAKRTEKKVIHKLGSRHWQEVLCKLVGTVLASYGCCNKVPHAEWLETIEIYCYIILEIGSLKSRCQRAILPQRI